MSKHRQVISCTAMMGGDFQGCNFSLEEQLMVNGVLLGYWNVSKEREAVNVG